jgi:hypothetical protein
MMAEPDGQAPPKKVTPGDYAATGFLMPFAEGFGAA